MVIYQKRRIQQKDDVGSVVGNVVSSVFGAFDTFVYLSLERSPDFMEDQY